MARKEQYHSIYSALYRMDEIYDVEMDQEMFESLAMEAYRKIGNKNSRRVIRKETVTNYRIEIPSNLVDVLAITDSPGDYTNLDANGTHPLIDDAIPGGYLDYEIDGGEFILPHDGMDVYVCYTTEQLDDDGFPLVTEKESEAISNYCLAIHYFKKAMVTKDNSMMTGHQLFEQKWKLTVDQARVPEHISDDTMNKLGDINTRADRKSYKKPFKFIK